MILIFLSIKIIPFVFLLLISSQSFAEGPRGVLTGGAIQLASGAE